MAYEKKPNEGSLFKNNDKVEGDTRPHAKGDGIVQFTADRDIKAGEIVTFPVWISAYTNTAKSGERWQRVLWKQKQPRQDAPAPAAAVPAGDDFNDDLSDIPF